MLFLSAAPDLALRWRWRCRRGNFRVTPFPGALRCARSQAAGLWRASASRGGGMGDARGGAWERWGEGRNLSTSGILGSVSGL